MNISSVQLKNIAFQGIRPPYMLKDGTKITPICQDPSEKEVKQAIEITETKLQKNMEGLNGKAYCLGEDLIVKKYKGEKAISNDPDREINLLDQFFDYGLYFKNSQKGCYAIKTKNGQTYLVSTKVQGQNPSVKNNVLFNKENLQSLSEIIIEMDKGCSIPNSSQMGFSDRCRFMNYDFNGGNIKITPTQTGLFDFEYNKFENIDDYIYNSSSPNKGYNCNQSDTSTLPSCIRSFEYWTLCDYLKEVDTPYSIFNDYLEIKGNYHKKMSEFFKEFSNESSFPKEIRDIAKKEAVHSRLLKKDINGKIPQDILKSEAKKIQMANFLHEQGIFNVTGIINPEQLPKYTKETIDYFESRLNDANINNDSDRIIYYQDCLELVKQWNNVNEDLARNVAAKNPNTMKKITHEHIKTLDDVLNI